MENLIVILLYFITPALLLWLTKRYSFLEKIGVVVLSYATGLIFTFSGMLPDDIGGLQDTLNTILIPVSIPLLLFSTDLQSVLNLTPSFMKSMLIGMFSLVVTVVSGYFIFMSGTPGGEKIAGLLAGVYSGGTPNLASIKAALGVDSNTYILVHSSDLVVGAFFLLFFISVAQRLLNLILPSEAGSYSDKHMHAEFDEELDIISGFRYGKRKKSALVMGLSIVVFGSGGGLSLLFPEEYSTAIAILSITTFSILLSMYKPINQIRQSFSIGMYLILVFSVIVSSMVDVSKFTLESLNLFYYVAWGMFGTFVLQVILSRIFRISTDVTIITATALSMSPPFVPVVAGALKNKSIITPGIIVGIVGYIIGNYFGVMIAYSL